jgi:hypothetical protein
MKFALGVTIFNFFAAAVCLVAFVFDVYVGSWTFAALQLALASLNFYLGYINYQRYEEMKVYYNDGN